MAEFGSRLCTASWLPINELNPPVTCFSRRAVLQRADEHGPVPVLAKKGKPCWRDCGLLSGMTAVRPARNRQQGVLLLTQTRAAGAPETGSSPAFTPSDTQGLRMLVPGLATYTMRLCDRKLTDHRGRCLEPRPAQILSPYWRLLGIYFLASRFLPPVCFFVFFLSFV